MPDPTISDVAKEAYASAQVDLLHFDTYEISHPDLPFIGLVNNNKDITVTTEDGTRTFAKSGVKGAFSNTDNSGAQTFQITINDNTGIVRDYVRQVRRSLDPVVIKYRRYLSSDLTQPQSSTQELEIVEADITKEQSVLRTVGEDLPNKRAGTIKYDFDRFKGLRTF